ncbi:MAG: split hand foot malformation (ectrodactyly) type 1 [Tremellales sp. Tagirdzhanova-0007]|nr:MAG: split hand foot malformation (ectrodactyly) type 1 [Tremellales sp. Tagirdzhanova-0007]
MSKPQPPPVAEKKAGDTTKVPANEKQEIEEKKKLPQLGALEDDDEFEDFPANVEGSGKFADALNNNAPGDHLWEDNWDDDDIEDDFTKQLRTAINERNGVADEAMKD